MFGKKETVTMPTHAYANDGDPWDQETFVGIGASDRINLHLTHLENRQRDGTRSVNGESQGRVREVIGSGFLPSMPQHVHVELTFEAALDEFGVAVFDYQLNERYRGLVVHVPVIRVVLQDADDGIKNALREAMRDAILSNVGGIELRCWTTFPQGWDSRSESHTIRRDITGFNIWSPLHSPRIPSWQMPIGENDLSSIPDATMLRRAPDRG